MLCQELQEGKEGRLKKKKKYTHSVAFQSSLLHGGEVLQVPFKWALLKELLLTCSNTVINNNARQPQLSSGHKSFKIDADRVGEIGRSW